MKAFLFDDTSDAYRQKSSAPSAAARFSLPKGQPVRESVENFFLNAVPGDPVIVTVAELLVKNPELALRDLVGYIDFLAVKGDQHIRGVGGKTAFEIALEGECFPYLIFLMNITRTVPPGAQEAVCHPAFRTQYPEVYGLFIATAASIQEGEAFSLETMRAAMSLHLPNRVLKNYPRGKQLGDFMPANIQEGGVELVPLHADRGSLTLIGNRHIDEILKSLKAYQESFLSKVSNIFSRDRTPIANWVYELLQDLKEDGTPERWESAVRELHQLLRNKAQGSKEYADLPLPARGFALGLITKEPYVIECVRRFLDGLHSDVPALLSVTAGRLKEAEDRAEQAEQEKNAMEVALGDERQCSAGLRAEVRKLRKEMGEIRAGADKNNQDLQDQVEGLKGELKAQKDDFETKLREQAGGFESSMAALLERFDRLEGRGSKVSSEVSVAPRVANRSTLYATPPPASQITEGARGNDFVQQACSQPEKGNY